MNYLIVLFCQIFVYYIVNSKTEDFQYENDMACLSNRGKSAIYNNKVVIYYYLVIPIETISSDLLLDELPIAFYDSQHSWLNNGESTSIRVDQLVKILTGSNSKNYPEHNAAIIVNKIF